MAPGEKPHRPKKSSEQLMVNPHEPLVERHGAERAQADDHFRQRDQELLVALRATSAAESEQAIRYYTRRRCPKCGEPLENTPSPWAKMGACPRCGGIWLDKGAWEGLVGPASQQLAPTAVRWLMASKQARFSWNGPASTDWQLCRLCFF